MIQIYEKSLAASDWNKYICMESRQPYMR